MPDDYRERDGMVQVPIIDMFSDLKRDMTEMRKEINTSFTEFSKELKDSISSLSNRMSKIENWQLTHETDGHGKLQESVKEHNDKLKVLEDEYKQGQNDQKARDKRNNTLVSVIGGIIAFLTFLALFFQDIAPFIMAHH